MKNLFLIPLFIYFLFAFIGCGPVTYFTADYSISLEQVERPQKAAERYGAQKVDKLSNDARYKYLFEDDIVKVSWYAGSRNIYFAIENKTDYSIKIPWDEAAFVDENGTSHRVIHAGVKYTDKANPQSPSVIVRKGKLEDLVFPVDYVEWNSKKYSTGWDEKPFFYDLQYIGMNENVSIAEFEKAVNGNTGKTYQVLLPLQIEDVINDYIFTFKVNDVKAEKKTL